MTITSNWQDLLQSGQNPPEFMRHPEIIEEAGAQLKASITQEVRLRWGKQAIRNAKASAARTNVPFEIVLSDVLAVYPEFCPVLGWRIMPTSGRGNHRGSPTLFRYRPHEGFVSGNIGVISNAASMMMRTLRNTDGGKTLLDWMLAHDVDIPDLGPTEGYAFRSRKTYLQWKADKEGRVSAPNVA